MRKLLWLICLVPGICFSQSIKLREYKKGDHFKYKLTTEVFTNGKPDSKTISISQHTIIKDSGRLVEEIKWLSKTVESKTDTLHYDSIAHKVAPYRVSLLKDGQ